MTISLGFILMCSIYMIWICTLGSAILGDWLWWLLMLVSCFFC